MRFRFREEGHREVQPQPSIVDEGFARRKRPSRAGGPVQAIPMTEFPLFSGSKATPCLAGVFNSSLGLGSAKRGLRFGNSRRRLVHESAVDVAGSLLDGRVDGGSGKGN